VKRRFVELTLMVGAVLSAQPAAATVPESAVPTVTLKEALRRAESDPPSVLVAAAAVESAAASESFQRGSWLPSLTASANAGIAYDNRIVIPALPRIDSTSLIATGTATLDWTGYSATRFANIDAAKAQLKARGYGKEAAQRLALVLASEMYVRAYAATELVRDAEVTVERRTSQYDGILNLTKTGLRQPVEAQRAEVEAVSARYVLVARQDDEVASWAALAVAMGRSPMSPLRPEGSAADVFAVAIAPERAKELALRSRPELKQSRATVLVRKAEESAATGGRLPIAGVAVNGTLSYNDTLSISQSSLGINGSQYGATALAYVRWSGLDPAVWYKADVAEAATVEAERQLGSAALSVAAEAVAMAHAVLRAKTERDRAVAVLESASATEQAQNGRYRAGLSSLLELLDAENLEQDARRRRIEAERDYEIAGARLLAACGLLAPLAR
jgi:outer membrane protein